SGQARKADVLATFAGGPLREAEVDPRDFAGSARCALAYQRRRTKRQGEQGQGTRLGHGHDVPVAVHTIDVRAGGIATILREAIRVFEPERRGLDKTGNIALDAASAAVAQKPDGDISRDGIE